MKITMEEVAKDLFLKSFGYADLSGTVGVRAPGRVNLIGEHTDYQQGFVMPIAIEFETFIVAKKVPNSNICKVVSAQQGEKVESFVVDSNFAPGETKWFKYVQGVIAEYFKEELKGKEVAFEAAFASNVPLGGGLSSSASLEVATATMLEAMYGITDVDPVKKALRCVEAEHEYANVPCGIMDQFASSLGKKDHALLLDCRTQKFDHIPLVEPSIAFVITNSNAPHTLSGSEYPDRVRQCKEAVNIVKGYLDATAEGSKSISFLRDITMDQLKSAKESFHANEISYRRAQHVISENDRVCAAVQAFKDHDYVKVGKLMISSHNSLRDDFEVSTKELDTLVEIACSQEGVFGSRMTGGGFGGCTVTLVKAGAVENLIQSLYTMYKERIGVECTCFITKPADGAKIVWHSTNTTLFSDGQH